MNKDDKPVEDSRIQFPAIMCVMEKTDGSIRKALIDWRDTQDNATKILLNVRCYFEQGFYSFIELKFSLGGIDPETRLYRDYAKLYLNCFTVQGIEVKQVVSRATELDETGDRMLVDGLLFSNSALWKTSLEEGRVLQVEITLKPCSDTRYHDENLFLNHQYLGNTVDITEIRQYLKETGKINLYVLGTPCRVRSDFEEMAARFVDDLQSPPDKIWSFPSKFKMVGDGNMLDYNNFPESTATHKGSYTDFTEYQIKHAYAIRKEEQYKVNLIQKLERKTLNLVVAPVTHASGRYRGYILVSGKEVDDHGNSIASYQPQPGDVLGINFSLTNAKTGLATAWVAKVIPSNSITPPGYTTLILTQPYNHNTKAFIPLDPPLMPVEVGTLPRLGDATQAIKDAPGRRVRLLVHNSPAFFNASMFALSEIRHHRPEIERLLLGNSLDSLPSINIYDGIDGYRELLQSLGLNAEQYAAIISLEQCKGGLGLIHGPPGTGKTSLTKNIAVPFIQSRILDPERRHQVMHLGPTNSIADNLAVTMDEFVQRKWSHDNIIVVRVYARNTHPGHVLSTSARPRSVMGRPFIIPLGSRGKPLSSAPSGPAVGGTLDGDLLAELECTTDEISRAHATAMTRPAGVNDMRLKLLKLSVAYRILEGMGVYPSTWANPNAFFEDLHQYWLNWRNGDVFDDDEMMEFQECLRKAHDKILQIADVIVGTTSIATDPCIYRNAHPTIVAVDEAVRVKESELWPVLAHMHQRATILIGDEHQLKPLSFCPAEQNRFKDEVNESLYTRLKKIGHEAATLCVQYRMPEELSAPISKIWYNSKLRAAEGLPAEIVLLNRQIVDYNSMPETFDKKDRPLLFIDVEGSEQCSDARGVSVTNPRNASTVFALLVDLTTRGRIPADVITVLTPYRGQLQLYTSLLQRIDNMLLQGIKIRTVDSYQGDENGVVILDLIATKRNALNFVAHTHRLCVATSRARAGLYVIGAWKTMCLHAEDRFDLDLPGYHYEEWLDSDRRKRVRPLKLLLNYIRDHKLYCTAPESFKRATNRAKRILGIVVEYEDLDEAEADEISALELSKARMNTRLQGFNPDESKNQECVAADDESTGEFPWDSPDWEPRYP